MKDRLKELRKRLGIKQRELAERLEVAVGLVGQWEAGVCGIPRARVYQICNEYGVRREWLERGEGEIFEKKDGIDEKLQRVAFALFEELSDRGKKAVVEALRERVEGIGKTAGGAGKAQINNGTIGGDMVQN